MEKVTEEDIRKIIEEIIRSRYTQDPALLKSGTSGYSVKLFVIPGTAAAENLPAVKVKCVDDADFILLDELSTDMLVNLANGCSDQGEYRVIEALKRGKRILVLRKGIQYLQLADVMPPALKYHYDDCLKKIETYGVQVIADGELLEILKKKETRNQMCVEKGVIFFKKYYLSEKEIRELNRDHNVKEIKCASHTNISPLARDYARKEAIQLTENSQS